MPDQFALCLESIKSSRTKEDDLLNGFECLEKRLLNNYDKLQILKTKSENQILDFMVDASDYVLPEFDNHGNG